MSLIAIDIRFAGFSHIITAIRNYVAAATTAGDTTGTAKFDSTKTPTTATTKLRISPPTNDDPTAPGTHDVSTNGSLCFGI